MVQVEIILDFEKIKWLNEKLSESSLMEFEEMQTEDVMS